MKRSNTSTFLLELPLRTDAGQAKRLAAHLEVGRCFYNNMLGEARRRLARMRNDLAWLLARTIRSKSERHAAYNALRTRYGFSEFSLHRYATTQRVYWLAEHLDSNTAQKLASRAYQAVNRVCLGQAKHVRFKSRGRGLDSVEGKSNTSGLRFTLQDPTDGNAGFLQWQGDRIEARIDWHDPVVAHSLRHRVKYCRLIRRRASSERCQGADAHGYRYCVQLILEGEPYQKPKHAPGSDIIGLDIGPQTLAIVSQEQEARLITFCDELRPNARERRRLQRRLDRQRRANNPEHYDEQGRCKPGRKRWNESRNYQKTRQRLAAQERRLAAHRKSLHGRLAHEIVQIGTTITIEKTSYKGWQRRFGRSIGLRAPGMFVEHLKRTVAKTGGMLREVSAFDTRLSQYCHGCRCYVKKPLSQRWHHCPCGIGPVQRDLYSATLLAFLPQTSLIPSMAPERWAGVETRLTLAMEGVQQRASGRASVPASMGLSRERARQRKSLAPTRQEPSLLCYRRNRVEALVPA
jgi:transposase